MNKSQQLKSRLVYLHDMTLYVTYVSDEGDQLIVALSVQLHKSHVMTDNLRYFDMEAGRFVNGPSIAVALEDGPTTARAKGNFESNGDAIIPLHPLKIKVDKSSRLTLYFENKDMLDATLS